MDRDALQLLDKPSPKVKGTLVVAVTKLLRARGIDPAVVIDRLPEADREVLRGILLPTGWYSRELFARLAVEAANVLSPACPEDAFTEMGHFSANVNFGPGGARRAFIHGGDPHYVLAALPRFHTAVYNTGMRTYQSAGERAAIIRHEDTARGFPHCRWTTGFLRGIVELSGGKDVRAVETRCRYSGAPSCEYRVDWS